MANSKRPHAFSLFFPAAALHAALVVPLTLFAAYGGLGWPPGLVPLIWFLNETLLTSPAFPWHTDARTLMHFGVLCLLLLMTFMGGRLLAPAAAGTLEKKGIPLEARVQPRVEAMLIGLLLTAALAYPAPVARPLAGLLLLAAGILILVRTLRWKLWHCPDRPDLLVLALGYGWLAAGSLMTGASLVAGQPVAASLHLITI